MAVITPIVPFDKSWVMLGCPRSGTQYTAQFYRKAGFLFAHERTAQNGGCGWNLVMGDLSTHAAVFHQVRHPKDCLFRISCNWDAGTRKRMADFAGPWETEEGSPGRGVEFWVKWNELCAKKALFTYRVEDLNPGSPVTARIHEVLGLPDVTYPELVKTVNATEKHAKVSRAEALQRSPKFAEMAFVLAEQYGYVWE